MPRQGHVPKNTHSASATSASECHLELKMGPRTILKNKFFCEDKNLLFLFTRTKTQTTHICRDLCNIL